VVACVEGRVAVLSCGLRAEADGNLHCIAAHAISATNTITANRKITASRRGSSGSWMFGWLAMVLVVVAFGLGIGVGAAWEDEQQGAAKTGAASGWMA
jgi:hypothetical protein